MKLKIFGLLAVLLAFNFYLQAQSAVTEMNIHGLRVIFKPSSKQTVSAYMFYKGGTSNYTPQEQGIESLTLSAATECGTGKYTKDAFKDMADKYGIEVSGGSDYDYGYICMSCVKPYFNEGWTLFAEAVNHPIFNTQEFSLLQQKKISGLKSQESNPDNELTKMTMLDAFKDTRYAIRPEGTVETVSTFKAEDAKNYYSKLLNVNRLTLVIVGNLSVQDVKQKVEAAFNKLPSAPVSVSLATKATHIETNSLNIEKRMLATNYIAGVMGAPAANDPSYEAYRLACMILYEKLFEEVRTKRNLSYAPSASLISGVYPYTEIYVTTTKPKEAVSVMVDEIKRLSDGGFTETDLKNAKSKLATSYFMQNESTSSNARSLGVFDIRGSWKDQATLLDRINQVTLAQMQKVFTENAKGIKWNYLGDETLADKEAFAKTVK